MELKKKKSTVSPKVKATHRVSSKKINNNNLNINKNKQSININIHEKPKRKYIRRNPTNTRKPAVNVNVGAPSIGSIGFRQPVNPPEPPMTDVNTLILHELRNGHRLGGDAPPIHENLVRPVQPAVSSTSTSTTSTTATS